MLQPISRPSHTNPFELSFTSSAINFVNWWSMWKTHVFQKALGPMLQKIHAEYEVPEEEILPLIQCFPPDSAQFLF
jgi:membrane-bound lytic murein transglycosylase B